MTASEAREMNVNRRRTASSSGQRRRSAEGNGGMCYPSGTNEV